MSDLGERIRAVEVGLDAIQKQNATIIEKIDKIVDKVQEQEKKFVKVGVILKGAAIVLGSGGSVGIAGRILGLF